MVTPLEGQPVCPIVIRSFFKGVYSGSGNETTTDQKLSGDVVASSEAPNLLHCLLISAYSYCLSATCLFSHSPAIICTINRGPH